MELRIRGVDMNRSFFIRLLVCLIGVSFVSGNSLGVSSILSSGEIILGERAISDEKVEVFIERGGKSYVRTYSVDGDMRVLKSEDEVEVRKRGLDTDRIPHKSNGVGEIVEKYVEVKGLRGESPTKVDYSQSEYLPPAGDQVDNSCVGWAVGYYLRTYQLGQEKAWSIDEGGELVESRVFSPNFVYNQINGGRDNGATLDDAGELLKDVGIATMADFKYIPGDYRSKPSYEVIRKGYKYRIEDYHILFSRSDEGEYKLNKVRDYLITGDLPVIGVDAGYSWEHPHRDEDGNYMILKDDTYIGGHAVLVVGYDDNFITPDGIGAFKILNSWGSDWGSEGYAYISYQAMAEDAISAAVYTDLSRFYVEDTHKPYLSGYQDNRFRPNRFVTRAESVKMIMGLRGEEGVTLAKFKDIDENHWARTQISSAYEKDYISGYPDGSFRPDEYITRAEAVTIINKIEERVPDKSAIKRLDISNFEDLKRDGKKHWAYYDIVEASTLHTFKYELEEGELVETWNN